MRGPRAERVFLASPGRRRAARELGYTGRAGLGDTELRPSSSLRAA